MPHFMRDIQTFGGLAVHQKPVITAPTALPVIIQVDPIAGSDALNVDGISSPLKTVEAALKRAVDIRTWKQADLSSIYAYSPVVIDLLPGIHTVGTVQYEYIYASLRDVTIRGSWQDVTTFTVDSYAGEGCRISKPAGDPPWIVDELVGKWIEFEAYPTYWPGQMIRWPIMANTTHELTVAWSPAPPVGWSSGGFPAPAIGTVLKIRDLASTLTGPGSLFITMQGIVSIQYLNIAPAVSTPAGYMQCFFSGAGTTYITQCKIDGAGGAAFAFWTSGFGVNLWTNNCLFMNCDIGGGVIEGGIIATQECCFINCSRPIFALNARAAMTDWDVIHSRNCSYIFEARASQLEASTFAFHCIDTNSIFALEKDSTFNCAASYNVKVVDGKAPRRYIDISPNNARASMRQFTDATLPTDGAPTNKPINIGGVTMTWDELHNLYYDHYIYGLGTEIIGGV